MLHDDILNHKKWTEWNRFPDPRMEHYLTAPFGFGLYQLRNGKKFILFGIGKHLAYRMSSLLPKPYGQGTRNNEMKRRYVLDNITKIEYRTISFQSEAEMKAFEISLKEMKIHLFNT